MVGPSASWRQLEVGGTAWAPTRSSGSPGRAYVRAAPAGRGLEDGHVSATAVIDHLAVRWRLLDTSLRDPARFAPSRALAGGPLDAAIDARGRPR